MEYLIRDFFDSQAILSEEEWQFFKSCLIKREFKKGDTILKEGDTENYLSFNIEGISRMFIINANGSDISLGFAFPNDFICEYSSFILRKPTKYNIECLEDCTMYSISYENLNKAYNISQTGERLGRINAEYFNIYLLERNVSLLTENAEQRYLNLMQKDKKIAQKIALKHIASYLGITPESLSRIRKNFTISIS